MEKEPGEIRAIAGDGTGEPVRPETGQKEPERTPLNTLKNQGKTSVADSHWGSSLRGQAAKGGKELRERGWRRKQGQREPERKPSQHKAKTKEKQIGRTELKGGGWRRNTRETRPIAAGGTREGLGKAVDQRESERKPSQNKAKTKGKHTVPTTTRVTEAIWLFCHDERPPVV